ncbi:unnamed protein product [Prorocentrum cordatum]|uniref:Nucleotide-diphospho-sugar transferase domain-containing protein n=1 Tax=Prorocentrum cordatum TaxID=2364126 RepID=A0ABN9X9A8_9DINO|nr:unnamed protein product [Polarella glacialis]
MRSPALLSVLLLVCSGDGALQGGAGEGPPQRAASATGPLPVDLEFFEDDDCLEVPGAEELLALLHDMCLLLERVLFAADRSSGWAAFDEWRQASAPELAPYCEPGKLASTAAQCLLVLRQEPDGANSALECAASLDEDLWAQMTPLGKDYSTRLHLVLRSPWPAFRLLDLLVRLHPESGSTRMGACRRHQNWQSEPDIFDWPWFKSVFTSAVDFASMEPGVLDLRPEDGPLSAQYEARWLRLYGDSFGVREAMSFSDDVFEVYSRVHQYKAGCHLGVISSYLLQTMLVHLRDIDGCLQRFAASTAKLINLHAQVWLGPAGAPRAPEGAAARLCGLVAAAAGRLRGGGAGDAPGAAGEDGCRGARPVFLTAAWGALAPLAGRAAARWSSLLGGARPLLLLALDAQALAGCEAAAGRGVHCLDAPRRFGVEGAVAKYLALAVLAGLGLTAVWLDLDVYVARDPAPHVCAALGAGASPDLVFARHLTSESVSPAVVAARGTEKAAGLLLQYASWLRENVYLLDHRGWDQFLDNRAGDFAGGVDYKGRNVTTHNDSGPAYSFLPRGIELPVQARFAKLGAEFGSGDGWLGDEAASGLALFHFWGAREAQTSLADVFFPHDAPGFPERALALLAQYRRTPTSKPTLPALLHSGIARRHPLHLVAVSYAHGCCKRSLRRNRQKALAAGVDEARAYNLGDLDRGWAARHSALLSQKRGAGWWLWKPHLILRTLRDPAVPWHRGVVLWVDAGNYLHADPRPLVADALRGSDVVALRLKGCLERDWTYASTLQWLNASERYAVVDRPQLGAYFLVFRKTRGAIRFAEQWLERAQEPEALLGAQGAANWTEPPLRAQVPSFQKHQADQSVFSVLFKEHGFRAISLEEGHRVVTLARWRE